MSRYVIVILTDTWYHIISKVHDDIFTINTRLSFMGLLLIIYFSCFHHMRNKEKKKKPKKQKAQQIRNSNLWVVGKER